MTDFTQILLVIVVSTLTVLLTIIGVQIFLILIEVKNILKKTASMMDDAKRVTHAVVESANEASSFLTGLKSGFGVIKKIKRIFVEEER
jgi:hypothetical protein